ncbi:uncharacterized protein TNCV_304151 [Trichonephila clavipes]|nr:uncharacterized protein TNCV_304151 [Trichonephila clavipes]
MTCTPVWPEITRELIPGQNSTDRHDLTARVFKVKVQKLVSLLTKVPHYYTWNVSLKEWKRRRVQGTPADGWPGVKAEDALGRIYTVSVSNFERYCLRMLLNVI